MAECKSLNLSFFVGDPLVRPEDYAHLWVTQINELLEPDILDDSVQSELRNLSTTVLSWPEDFHQEAFAISQNALVGQRQTITAYELIARSALRMAPDTRLSTVFIDTEITSCQPLLTLDEFTSQVYGQALDRGISEKALLTKRGNHYLASAAVRAGWLGLQDEVVTNTKAQIKQFTADRVNRLDQHQPAVDQFIARVCLDKITESFGHAIDNLFTCRIDDQEDQLYYIQCANDALDEITWPYIQLNNFMQDTAGLHDDVSMRDQLQAMLDAPANLTAHYDAAVQNTAQLMIKTITSYYGR